MALRNAFENVATAAGQGGMDSDLTPATGTVTVGSPLVITPSLGHRLRVWWVLIMPSPDNTSTGRATANLDGKGEIYRSYVVGHRQRFDGAVNTGGGQGALTVACTDGTFEATVHYEETT